MLNVGKKVTIFDVAKVAGVSISTVSRVMNGNYPVTEELRKRVLQAIKELGYTPDSVARSMKSKRRYAIGLVVSDITNRHFTLISKAIDDIIGPMGTSLIVCNTDSSQEREARAIKMLLANRVDGLIINTSGKNDAAIATISKNLPVVLLHRRIDADGFAGDYVGSDNYTACATLAKRAISAGHKEIGIITSDQTISTFRERTKGFINTATSMGVIIPEDRIIETPYTEVGGYQASSRLFADHPELTLVAIMNNATAIGAYQWAQANAVAIPDKVSVLSFGEILHANLMSVKPAFMTQQPLVVGAHAASLILSRLEEPKRPSETVVVEAQYEKGTSIKILD